MKICHYFQLFLRVLVLYTPVVFCEEPLSLSLREAQNIALENNFAISTSYTSLRSGEFDVDAKRKAFYPSVAFSSNLNTGHNSETYSGVNALIEISQTLYDRGVSCTLSQSKIERNRLCLLLQKQICDTLFALRSAYFTYLLHQSHLKIDVEMVEIWEREVKRQEKFFEVGGAIPFELTQTKLHLKEARMDMYKTESLAYQSRVNLLYVLGLSPTTSIVLSDPSIIPPPVCTGKEEGVRWCQAAMKWAPDLKYSELTCKLASIAVSKIEAEKWPTLNAYASAGHNYVNNGFSLQPSAGVGVNLDWNLYDPTRKSRLRSTQEALKGSRFDYEAAQLQIEGAVYTTLFEIEKNYQSYLLAKESVSLAEESVRMALKKSEVGLISLFELRDTIDNLHFAKTQECQALFDWRHSYDTLIQLVGLDLQELRQRD